MKKIYLLAIATLIGPAYISAQATYEAPDPDALERIYVERYYISDEADACDEDGGSLPVGSVTYRVYADLKPGYELQTIYGNAHPLRISTTTEFFNNEDRGETNGGSFDIGQVNDNTVVLDSYLSMGYAAEGYYAVPKHMDSDGSIIGGALNDGGSCNAAEGLISNDDELACEPVTMFDGLTTREPQEMITVGLANDGAAVANTLHMFDDQNSADDFFVDNGGWAVLGGTQGIDDENMILIGQFTTDGVFTFELNMRIGIPEELQCDSVICPTAIDYFAQILDEDTVGQPQYIIDTRIEKATLTFDSSVDELTCFTSLTEQQLDAALEVFPNPATDVLNLRLPDSFGERLQVILYDAQGRSLERSTIVNGRSELDLGAYPQGLYIIEVLGDVVSTSRRIIKE